MTGEITGYPPVISRLHGSLSQHFASYQGGFFVCRSVDKVNSKGQPKNMVLLMTKEFIFVAKDNGTINRAVWLSDVDSIYVLSTKLLVKTRSGCAEPGLIMMSHDGDMRNSPSSLITAAETMAHAVSAATGKHCPFINLGMGGGQKPFINMQKTKAYMKPCKKLKLLRSGGGFTPKRYPPQGAAGSQFATPPPPPVAGVGGVVSLVEEPAPPSFGMVKEKELEREREKEKESPPLPPRKASITPDEAGNLDQYVFAPQPPSPSHRTRPHHSPSRQQKRLSLPARKSTPPAPMSRVGSLPQAHRHSLSPLKRHSSSRKDGFWKEFVRDYDALERQWEVDEEKRRNSISLGSPRDKRLSRRMSQEMQWAAV